MINQEEQWLESEYRNAFPEVAKIVRRLGGDQETARDLFHDAFIIYLEKKKNNTLAIRVSVTAYLAGIVKILWIKKFKNSRTTWSTDLIAEHLSVPEDFYSSREAENKSLLEQLQFAGQKCLQLLKAFYYDHLTTADIARKFNYSTSHTAAVQKYKCLEKIRTQIKSIENYEEIIAGSTGN